MSKFGNVHFYQNEDLMSLSVGNYQEFRPVMIGVRIGSMYFLGFLIVTCVPVNAAQKKFFPASKPFMSSRDFKFYSFKFFTDNWNGSISANIPVAIIKTANNRANYLKIVQDYINIHNQSHYDILSYHIFRNRHEAYSSGSVHFLFH